MTMRMEKQELDREKQMALEAEILRHLWYEAQATPLILSGRLQQPLPILYECLEDLIRRGFIYQFWPAPEGPDASVYCLTHRARRAIKQALQDYPRYKLQGFWEALKREQRMWLIELQL